jgi:hypothetical protein
MYVTSGAAVGVLCCAMQCCAVLCCSPDEEAMHSLARATGVNQLCKHNSPGSMYCTVGDPARVFKGHGASILGFCKHTGCVQAYWACASIRLKRGQPTAFAPHQYLWLSVVGLCSTKWPASLAAAPLPSVTPSATFSAPGGALPGTHVAVVCISTALLLRQQLRPDRGQGRGGV